MFGKKKQNSENNNQVNKSGKQIEVKDGVKKRHHYGLLYVIIILIVLIVFFFIGKRVPLF